MYDQLGFEGISKSLKDMGRTSDFYDFWSEELH
jgi:hypothetical protein